MPRVVRAPEIARLQQRRDHDQPEQQHESHVQPFLPRPARLHIDLNDFRYRLMHTCSGVKTYLSPGGADGPWLSASRSPVCPKYQPSQYR